ncbi:MAG: hypothetical protein SPL14_02695 [Candidatus Onthomorpha sp.]|nr:hypothetical protein [Candidatus Onthomorpha sp.]
MLQKLFSLSLNLLFTACKDRVSFSICQMFQAKSQYFKYHTGLNFPNTIHKSKPLYGLQFHPESFMTSCGKTIVQNWLLSLRSK